MAQKFKVEHSFIKPAVYKIKVEGDLNANWSDRLGGLQINVDRTGTKKPTSILVGQINDQAALSGVLNTLYELHMTIISVTMLKDET